MICVQKPCIFISGALAIVLAALYLLFVANNESNHELHMQFIGYADRIAENFNSRIHANLLALDSFSVSSTSYALDSGNSWPMVTIPDFAVRSWTTRQEMKAETLGLLPIVTSEKRQDWENYVIQNHNWIEEAREWEGKKGNNSLPSSRFLLRDDLINREDMSGNRKLQQKATFLDGVSSDIYTVNMEGAAVVDEGIGPFSPIWMTSPVPSHSRMINFNMLSHHLFWEAIEDCMYSRMSVLSRVLNLESNHERDNLVSSPAQVMEEPISSIFYPVFDSFEENRNLVAVLAAEIYWRSLFENSHLETATEVVCVIETACDQTFTFKIDGNQTYFLGSGDHHDTAFSDLVQTISPETLMETPEAFTGTPLDLGHCPFLLHVYPTSEMKENRSSYDIIILVSCVLAVIIFATLLFSYLKDFSLRIGRNRIENVKGQSTFRETLNTGLTRTAPKMWKKRKPRSGIPPHVEDFCRTLPERTTLLETTKTEILTNATIVFAGICSLGKWGEGKEIEETTSLLETIHQSFSVIAKRHGILQVEMIDDTFLAIVGSNDNDMDHAAVSVCFACECRKRISELFKSMCTKELSIRFGIHSGNVKQDIEEFDNKCSQFQLFGDTFDIARQMLESGKANRIQVSIDTAELLNLAGKSQWVSPRSDAVVVNGIGNMPTFWVKPKSCLLTSKAVANEKKNENSAGISRSQGVNQDESFSLDDISEKEFESLVDQNTAILIRYLRAIYAKRLALKQTRRQNFASDIDDDIGIGGSIVEEAREMIQPAKFSFKVSMDQVDSSLIQILPEVESQLRVYVASIGAAYQRNNAFHNFQHASYSVLLMDQIISRITSSSDIMQAGFDGAPRSKGEIAKEIDAKTYSISSDPIIQFAMVFSALVHDVDHTGVSNDQLIKNGSPLASLYKRRCISEQNSVDISWWLLMKTEFEDLRSAVYSDTSEMMRFRQVLVNSVLATDIFDDKMRKHRENNWNNAFVEKVKSKRHNSIDTDMKRNLQTTSIIECIIQLAVFGYRGQSFREYMKWNERLFEEAMKSFHNGSAEESPALHWYKSELHSFDNFLLPLLSRIVDSSISGGFGDSYLMQALSNRNAWKSGGEALVQDMVDRFSCRVVATQEDTIHFT